MRMMTIFCFSLMAALAGPAAAESVFQKAENKVPMAVVEVSNSSGYTEIRLQAQAAVDDVCWYSKGPNSPYLIAAGRRYRFVGGLGISACPKRQSYASGESMVLRFERLDSQINDVSLVEGEGGEKQMKGSSASDDTFWNFLHIQLR